MVDGEIPSPCLQFGKVQTGHVSVDTRRIRIKVIGRRGNLIGLVTQEILEGDADTSAPETEVDAGIVVVRLTPCKVGVRIAVHYQTRTIGTSNLVA